jgi:ABC-type bacteriocin/lantibiotic exporter with double-glycine peptidase domain
MEYKKYIVAGFFIVIGQTAVTFAIPSLIRTIIDTAQVGQFADIRTPVIYVFVLTGMLLLLKVSRTIFFARFSLNFKSREAKKLFQKLFRVKLKAINKNGPTYYTERIYNGLQNMFSLVGDVSIQITTICITLVVSLILAWRVNSVFFILFMILLPLTYFSYRQLNKNLQEKSEILQEKTALHFKYIINFLQNFIEIKKLGSYHTFASLCKKYIHKIQEETNRVNIFAQSASNLIQTLTDMVRYAILLYAIYLLLIDSLGFGDLVFIEMILVIYTNGLNGLTTININLRDINAFQKFVQKEILDQMEEDTGKRELETVDTLSINIPHFAYTPEKQILNGIDIEIKKGQCVGMVGDSGCGKSTVLNLLIRLYEADTISINGIPLTEYTLDSVRRHIYVVSQTPYLFPGTIEDNLYMGIARTQVRSDVLHTEWAQQFIGDFPQGLSTPIQEGAANLSGGQKQKIMVLRALLHDPQVVILDESTAEMDGASETQILDFLLQKKGEKIIIIISHRLSTIKKCDTILVLKNGKITERGSLEALKKSSIEFNRIFESQL